MRGKFNLTVLNLIKRRRKYIDLVIDIFPYSKRSMEYKKREAQREIIDQMKAMHQCQIPSDTAVEIIVYIAHPNPPRVERLAKVLLDLMWQKDHLDNSDDAKFLPIKDDSFVRFLSIKYIVAGGSSTISIRIRPFSSFVADLRFVNDYCGFEPEIKDDFEGVKEHYEDIVANKDQYVSRLSDRAYEAMLDFATLDMQKSLTSSMGISPFIMNLIYPRKGLRIESIHAAYQEWATMLLDFPIRIRLPEIPTQPNTSNQYKDQITAQLKDYIETRPIFTSLKSPVIVSAFYLPPEKKNGFKFKDLDNIMLDYVLPSFNKIFSPPVSPFNLHKKKSDMGESHSAGSFPRSLDGSAMGYEIIELPRKFSRGNKGFLNVGFRIDDLGDGIMHILDEKMEFYIENNKYV